MNKFLTFFVFSGLMLGIQSSAMEVDNTTKKAVNFAQLTDKESAFIKKIVSSTQLTDGESAFMKKYGQNEVVDFSLYSLAKSSKFSSYCKDLEEYVDKYYPIFCSKLSLDKNDSESYNEYMFFVNITHKLTIGEKLSLEKEKTLVEKVQKYGEEKYSDLCVEYVSKYKKTQQKNKEPFYKTFEIQSHPITRSLIYPIFCKKFSLDPEKNESQIEYSHFNSILCKIYKGIPEKQNQENEKK